MKSVITIERNKTVFILLFFLGPFYLVSLPSNATLRSFGDELNLWSTKLYIYCGFALDEFLLIIPYPAYFLMKIHVKYLRHDSYKMTLQFWPHPLNRIGHHWIHFLSKFRWLTAIKTVLLELFTLAKISPIKVTKSA